MQKLINENFTNKLKEHFWKLYIWQSKFLKVLNKQPNDSQDIYVILFEWSLLIPQLAYSTGYDMSPFIRRYAKYLNEKSLSYRAMAFDFCKVKRG